MAEQLYRCEENERIDRICKKVCGTERDGIVETVLNMNPHIARLGPLLPLGTLVKLPVVKPSVQVRKTVKLWD